MRPWSTERYSRTFGAVALHNLSGAPPLYISTRVTLFLKLCNAGGSRSLRPHVGAMVRLVRSERVDHPFARAVYDNAMC